MDSARSIVIVGAGQAARWLVLTLRADGFEGRIVLLGDEAHLPYERPPLSKAVIKGDVDVAQLYLLDAAKIATHGVDWRPSTQVVAIDRERRSVRTSHGEAIAYDLLFLATGGRARTLPGLAAHARVAYLRTYEDALAIKRMLAGAQHVLVLGGGWIGLELASSARFAGKAVTVIEAAPRLCARTVPPCLSEHLRELHQGHGVDVRLGDGVQSVQPDGAGVSVQLAGGQTLRGDVMVAGLGLVPNDALAADAGLATSNGVLTDAWGRTEDPAVFAVGDVANVERAPGLRLRLESWENAQRHAVAAAKAALGVTHDPDADGPPWFWSDQYDENLQIIGFPDDRMQLVERNVPDKRQRLFYFCDAARIRAVAAVNGGRELKLARKWMLQGRFPALAALADPATDINKVALVAASAT